MPDILLIAFYAFTGAAATGLAGAGVLRLIRRRSLTASLAVVAAVAVLAMLAGTLMVAWAMFLSPHDLSVVTTVVAMAAVVSLATALLLGRWVVARSRELAAAARSFGDSGDYAAPATPATAELDALSRELAATSARLAESRARERALETSRRELVAWISHDLRTPLAGLRAMSEALEDGVAADPDRYLRQIRTQVERLNDMVGDLFELSRIQAGALLLAPSRISLYDLVGDALAGAVSSVPGKPIPAARRTTLRPPSQPTAYRARTVSTPPGPRTSASMPSSSWRTPVTSWPRVISTPSSAARSASSASVRAWGMKSV